MSVGRQHELEFVSIGGGTFRMSACCPVTLWCYQGCGRTFRVNREKDGFVSQGIDRIGVGNSDRGL